MAKDVDKKSPKSTQPDKVKPIARATSPSELPTVLPELHPGLIRSLVEAVHPQPHATLGQHPVEGGFVIRTVRPLAHAVTAIRTDGSRVPLEHVADGLWQGFAPGVGQAYTLETKYSNGPDWVADDPYRFVPSVGDVDLYLWGQGRHEQLWKVFGAQYRPHEDVEGTSFSVWAPHATAARVLGDFNGWNGVGHAWPSVSYGTPSAAGARERPTKPATARIVRMYGRVLSSWTGTFVSPMTAPCSEVESALP